MAKQQLDRAGVAARCGIEIKTVDVYRTRPATGFPEPDGFIGRSPWWYDSTIDKWEARRRRLTPKVDA